MLIPTLLLQTDYDPYRWNVLMPLRASCSFQPPRMKADYGLYKHTRLNAPQGFMLIPTGEDKAGKAYKPVVS